MMQIPVVDADQHGVTGQGLLQFGLVVHFDQNVEPDFTGQRAGHGHLPHAVGPGEEVGVRDLAVDHLSGERRRHV